MPRILSGAILSLLIAAGGALAVDAQQVAATPPMGWNSWNHFAGRVTDKDVRAAADALVVTGMRDAGYVYVNIDDTWEGERDAQGVVHTNEKFPDMKALADYVHSRGLKLGIYSSPGPKTCAGFEGSYQHESQDAQTYAAWGVDYLKYDLCSYREVMAKESDGEPYREHAMMIAAYKKMHDALVATGRPIVYSLCQYGWDDVWEWGPSVGGNLWRTTGDIEDKYSRMAEIGFDQSRLQKYAAPGHWNDPDMLEVGNGGMNGDEFRTHMSLWAVLAAPLLAGNDLSRMSDDAKAILLNKDVIAIDQDPLGRQGARVWQTATEEVWTRALRGGRVAVALFNRGTAEAQVALHANQVGIRSGERMKNVWKGEVISVKDGESFAVPAHGVVLLVSQ